LTSSDSSSHVMPPTLPPPLFPYTPLFRSSRICRVSASTCPRAPCVTFRLNRTTPPRVPDLSAAASSADREVPPIPTTTSCPQSSDRKSTRLNSSHVEISYAVFCLKKKKKN